LKKVANTRSHKTPFLNTTMLTICFVAWIIHVVVVTWLVRSGVLNWGPVEIALLMGIPILTWAAVDLMLLLFNEQRRRTLSRPSPPGSRYQVWRQPPAITETEKRIGSGRRPRYSPQRSRAQAWKK